MIEKSILTFRTKLSARTLEQLLATACQRGFALTFTGIEGEDSDLRKLVKITFDHPMDRERFRAHMRRLAATSPRAPDEARSHAAKPEFAR